MEMHYEDLLFEILSYTVREHLSVVIGTLITKLPL